MLSWFSGPKLPGVQDVVAHGDRLRELSAALQRQRSRRSAAAALKCRVESAAGVSTVLQVKTALEACRPWATSGGDALMHAVNMAVQKHGDKTILSALPTDLAVFITTNTLSECNAIMAAATEGIAEVDAELKATSGKLGGPTLAGVVDFRMQTLLDDPSNAVASFAHLPLSSQESATKLCASLPRLPFLGLLDLTGCHVPAQVVDTDLFDAIATLQHLAVVSLAHNGLPHATARALAARLEQPGFCPSLRRVALHGNDFQASDLDRVADLLAERRHAKRRNSADGSSSNSGGDGGKAPASSSSASSVHRVLSLDGGGMRAVLQLEWIQRVNRVGRHLADDFDCVVASGWGGVIACALALRLPMSRVNQFFENVRAMALQEAKAAYHVEKAARATRGWWSGGNFYNREGLDEALATLFEDMRFDFSTINVVLVLLAEKRSHTAAAAQRIRVASAWRPRSLALGGIDIIDHDAPAPLIRELLACCLATPTCFAAAALPGSEVLVGRDALAHAANPALYAVLAAVTEQDSADGSGADAAAITSVAAFASPREADEKSSTAAIIAGTLEAFPADRDAAYERLVTIAQYSAAATAAAAQTFAASLPLPLLGVTRIGVQREGDPGVGMRIDEGNEEVIAAAREAMAVELGARQA